MDRTTLGRNVLPLEREGLIEIVPGRTDQRSKELRLTDAGAARLRAARKGWTEAQTRFEASFGRRRAAGLRALLHAVAVIDLGAAPQRRPLSRRAPDCFSERTNDQMTD